MGQRRMFSLKIINSARFLKMPIDSQVLYFHLGLHADDDGIVEAYGIMKLLGTTEDNLRVLSAKNFIKVLNEDLVTWISDWNEHNLIRADRKVDSVYKHLLLKIVPDAEIVQPKQRTDVRTSGRPVDNQRTGNGRLKLSKVKLSKENKSCSNSAAASSNHTFLNSSDFTTFWNLYPRKVGKKKVMEVFLKIEDVKIETMVRTIEEQKKSKQWQDAQFIPLPLTWLNQGRWDDEETVLTIEQEIKNLIDKCEKIYGKEIGQNAAFFDWRAECKKRNIDPNKYSHMFPNA